MTDLKCPACGALLQPHEKCGTETIVCGKCYAILALRDDRLGLIWAQPDAITRSVGDGPLQIGDQGTLRGRSLEVIGIVKRRDGADAWYEYALADAGGNVSWMWVDQGHFSVSVAEGHDCVTRDVHQNYVFRRHKLALYNRGTAYFVGAAGEFPFRLDPREASAITDYMAPPYVASYESRTWWVFEYIPYAEARRAFPKVGSPPEGIGINQPPTFESRRRGIGIVTVVAIILLFLIHGAGRAGGSSTPLLAAQLDLTARDAPFQVVGQFQLTRRWNALTLQISSPVYNSWTDLQLALVDDTSGRSYWTGAGVEFNTGVDSGGAWTEGSQFSSTVIRSIPAGSYTLLAKSATGTWSSGKAPISASVRLIDAGTPVGNLLLELLLILVSAALFFRRSYRFEVERWSMSDFSPYETKT
jgi:hypothetical protein